MMVDFFLALANDKEADVKDRIKAHEWLREHSTAGRPPQTAEVDVSVTVDDTRPVLDYSALTLDEALLWRQLHEKARRALPAPPEPAIVDVEVVEPEPEVDTRECGHEVDDPACECRSTDGDR